MRRVSHWILLGVVWLPLACGSGGPAPTGIAASLPERLPEANLERGADVRTFVGDSLWAYIDGDAEIYHSYRFVEVATAEYGAPGIELVADVYRFESPVYAYGLYTAIRPEGIRELGMGVAGFGSESSVDVVIGSHLVRVTALTPTDGAAARLQTAAAEISASLPGPAIRPATFGLFPAEHQKVSADRFFATSFLGQAFLSDVYTQVYSIDGRDVTLFVCESDPDTKLVLWLAEHLPGEEAGPGLPFEEGSLLWIPDSYDGAIAAGKAGRFLAGVVGYDAGLDDWLSTWLQSLTRSEVPAT